MNEENLEKYIKELEDSLKSEIGEAAFNIRQKFFLDISNSMDLIGMAGTSVRLNDEGKVVVEVLSPDDCLDLIELHGKGEELPIGLTIYNDKDEKIL